MTIQEYEAVRSERTHFLIHPGHQFPKIDSVVREAPRYSVVQKREGEADELASEHDPRP